MKLTDIFKRTITVAHIFGIPVRFDYRWFIVFILSIWLIAMNLARGKNLSEAALSAMRAQLPGGRAAQAAFDTGLALAQGKKLQDAAFAAAGRVLPPSRFAADALSFARAVASGQNIPQAALSTVGQRVLQGQKIDPQGAVFAAARRALPASPLAANALSFARTVASGKSLQDAARSTVGQRVLQGQKVYSQLRNMKRELPFG